MKIFAFLITGSLLLTSCTAGPNPLKGVPGSNGKVAGFWNGFWDGTAKDRRIV